MRVIGWDGGAVIPGKETASRTPVAKPRTQSWAGTPSAAMSLVRRVTSVIVSVLRRDGAVMAVHSCTWPLSRLEL